jgi:signal transduction histidine kinase
MAIHSELAIQIIDSLPYAVAIYYMDEQRVGYSNKQAQQLFKFSGLTQERDYDVAGRFIPSQELDQFSHWVTVGSRLKINESASIACKVKDSNNSKSTYEVTVVQLEDHAFSGKYLLITAYPLDGSVQKLQEEFINLAAHDLLSPSRKISTFVDRLKEKSPELASGNSYMERIDNSVENMRALISTLSEYALVCSRGVDITEFSMTELIDEILIVLKSSLDLANTRVEYNSLPILRSDREFCKLLFLQLLDNAIRFRKTGSDQHVIKIESSDGKDSVSDNFFYKIVVCDNGIGLPAEKAEEVFQPFVRLHGKSERGGTGMGLAICKKIAEVLGWEIYARGEEGAGTCFSLILPISNMLNVQRENPNPGR